MPLVALFILSKPLEGAELSRLPFCLCLQLFVNRTLYDKALAADFPAILHALDCLQQQLVGRLAPTTRHQMHAVTLGCL